MRIQRFVGKRWKRGVRGLILLSLVSFLLLTINMPSCVGPSCLTPADVDPTSDSFASDLSEAFAASTDRCGHSDEFSSEDTELLEQYFTPRTKPVTSPDHKYLLQPRFTICGSGSKGDPSDVYPGHDFAGNAGVGRGGDAESLDLLVLVLSPPQDVAVRNAIRNSWGSVVRESWPHSQRQWKVALIFLLGKTVENSEPPNTNQPEGESKGYDSFGALYKEWEVNGDLLVGDFVDSYRNVSLKVLNGLHWVSSRCDLQRVRYLLKVDQDSFVHVDHLLQALEHLHRTQPKQLMDNAIIGWHLCADSKTTNTRSKHYADPSLYPFSFYPVHLRGGSYIIPNYHVAKLANASHHLPLLPNEDVFFTGVVARSLHLRHVHLRGLMPSVLCSMTPCLFKGNNQLTATQLDVHGDLLSDMWEAVQAGPHCDLLTSLWTRVCISIASVRTFIIR